MLQNKKHKKEYMKKYYQDNKEKMNERAKKWREDNPEKIREFQRIDKRRYRKKHPEMRFGRKNWTKEHYDKWRVNYGVLIALKESKLKKEPCKVCGNSKVHGHHEDYSKPLEVIWLCSIHHKAIHNSRSLLN